MAYCKRREGDMCPWREVRLPSEWPPQHLKNRFQSNNLTARPDRVRIRGAEVWSTEVRVRAPERMGDDLYVIPPAPRLKTTERDLLPPGHRGEVGAGGCRIKALPIRDRKIDRRVGIEGQARQVESHPPVENVVVRKVAEVAETVWAGRSA